MAQKGFFIVVVVLLAVAFFASYYNEATGEAVRSRERLGTRQPLTWGKALEWVDTGRACGE